MDELKRVSPEIHKSDGAHFPIILMLDNVRSMNNVGSIFRTADAFNVASIMLCGVTPTPPHREIQKTALGATDSVHWSYVPDIEQKIQELKDAEYRIIGVEQVHQSISLDAMNWSGKDKKTVIIFGNEVEGISDEVLALCDTVIEIPQYGSKHSLNVSVSVGIILWDFVSKYNP